MGHETPGDPHPVKNEAAMLGFLTDVREAVLHQTGKRRGQRASRKR